MRRSKFGLVFLVVLLLAALPAVAQIIGPGRAAIQVKPAKLDFGDVPVKGSASLSVEISRTSTTRDTQEEELKIELRAPSAPFSLERTGGTLKLPPGGKLTVRVRCRPQDGGIFASSLGIIAKDRNNAIVDSEIVSLRCRGIEPILRVSPPTLDFGTIPFDKKRRGTQTGRRFERELLIENLGSDTLTGTASLTDKLFDLTERRGGTATLTALESSDGASLDPAEISFAIAPGGSLTIRVRVIPERASQAGNFTGSLRLKTNDRKSPTKNVTLLVEIIAPDIRVSPTKLNLGKIKVNEEKTATFEIENEGTDEGTVKLTSLCKEVKVSLARTGGGAGGGTLTLKPGQRVSAQVKVKPTEAGKLQCDVVIESDDPQNPLITLTVTAEATDRTRRGRIRPFNVSELQPVTLRRFEVFDLGGRKLYGTGPVSDAVFRWDARTKTGAPVANGVYFYIVSTLSQDGKLLSAQIGRLVVLR